MLSERPGTISVADTKSVDRATRNGRSERQPRQRGTQLKNFSYLVGDDFTRTQYRPGAVVNADFWGLRQSSICGAIANATSAIGGDLGHWYGNRTGNRTGNFAEIEKSWEEKEIVDGRPRMLIRLPCDCHLMFKHNSAGTGNWIGYMLVARNNALFYGADLLTYCLPDADVDERKTQKELILPWIMGFWPARFNGTGAVDTAVGGFPWEYNLPPLNPVHLNADRPASDPCGINEAPLVHMAPHIIHNLRRMAVAVAGIPPPSHPLRDRVEAWAARNLYDPTTAPLDVGPDVLQAVLPPAGSPPLVPWLMSDMDDAAVHFRCGDIFHTDHPSFGFLPYRAYSDRLSPDVRSIGIVTNPLEELTEQQQRWGAGMKPKVKAACRRVIDGLAVHLNRRFPYARVTVRAGSNETVVTSYTRLILANETVAGVGSFGVYPAIATFGEGYIRRPTKRKEPNHWVLPIVGMYDHIRIYTSNILMARDATAMQRGEKWDELMAFFQEGEDEIVWDN